MKDELLNILMRPTISWKNAIKLTGYSSAKVSRLIALTKRKYGLAGLTTQVRTDDFLKIIGTTTEREVERLNAIHD